MGIAIATLVIWVAGSAVIFIAALRYQKARMDWLGSPASSILYGIVPLALRGDLTYPRRNTGTGTHMGTASFHIGEYAKKNGQIIGSQVRVSGAFTTSTSAANLQDSTATNVTMAKGEVIQVFADEAMRIRFGGTAATASTGLYIPAGAQREIECAEAGLVSIVDVA